MPTNPPGVALSRKPLRLWPGVVIAVLGLLGRTVVPLVVPGSFALGIMGAMLGAVAIVLWWLLFSRAAWIERLGAVLLMVASLVATSRIVDRSIANGMMGLLLYVYAIPVLGLALVAWAVATRRLPNGVRRASMAAVLLIAGGVFVLARTSGVTGGAGSEFHWRWSMTPEERLLAHAADEPIPIVLPVPAAETMTAAASTEAGSKPGAITAAKPAAPPATSPASPAATMAAATTPALPSATSAAAWPGFRGRDRDGIAHGARIETDWARTPPIQIWRRPIGPGWSSFAVSGDFFFTQEQRGNDEIVGCYRLSTGQPVWRHRDAVRFWESNGGAGPRATPTLAGGRVYTFGATGILNALDESTGAVVWSRNVSSDSGVKVPMWGFASSPLLFDDVVVVAAAGKLAAYDIATGKPRWFGPTHGESYSSPHRVMIDGAAQVMLLSEAGATSVSPADGTVLWEVAWPGVTIVQPAVISGGDILISTSGAAGGLATRRIAVAHGPGGWTVQERWTSPGLKPYFNDLVVHKGHAYGFDGSILSCIDLESGKRMWKGGRYGYGQLMLLPEQDVLLVVSEEGELALVGATPDGFREIARIPGIQGKTWNHPVLVGDILLVRNGEEMAAFKLQRSNR